MLNIASRFGFRKCGCQKGWEPQWDGFNAVLSWSSKQKPYRQSPVVFSRKISLTSFAFNHYKTLGITKDAKTPDIKKAYFKLTKKHHPDAKHSNDFDEFVKVAEAYKVLGDPISRRRYDFEQFGISSDYNRFEYGEYNIPRHTEFRRPGKKRHQDQARPRVDTTIKMGLTPQLRQILDYLIGFLAATCIAMYLISRHQRKKHGENDDR